MALGNAPTLGGLPGFILAMRAGRELDVTTVLADPRRFDEYLWIDKTSAVRPIGTVQETGLPDTCPSGT